MFDVHESSGIACAFRCWLVKGMLCFTTKRLRIIILQRHTAAFYSCMYNRYAMWREDCLCNNICVILVFSSVLKIKYIISCLSVPILIGMCVIVAYFISFFTGCCACRKPQRNFTCDNKRYSSFMLSFQSEIWARISCFKNFFSPYFNNRYVLASFGGLYFEAINWVCIIIYTRF